MIGRRTKRIGVAVIGLLLGAVVLAGCTGGGHSAGSSGEGAAGATAPEGVSGDTASDTTPTLQTCGTVPTESTGPLAAIATLFAPTISPTGINGPIDPRARFLSYDADSTLRIDTAGPSLLMPRARAIIQQDGATIGVVLGTSFLPSEFTAEIPTPAGQQTISSGFDALGCDNSSLPSGTYQIVVIYDYQLFSDPSHVDYQLVSPPTTWTYP